MRCDKVGGFFKQQEQQEQQQQRFGAQPAIQSRPWIGAALDLPQMPELFRAVLVTADEQSGKMTTLSLSG